MRRHTNRQPGFANAVTRLHHRLFLFFHLLRKPQRQCEARKFPLLGLSAAILSQPLPVTITSHACVAAMEAYDDQANSIGTLKFFKFSSYFMQFPITHD